MSRKAKKKPFKWTVLRRKFLKAYFQLGDLGKAVRAAGSKCSTEASCQSLGSQILKDIQENAGIEEIMREAGLDMVSILAVEKEGLKATQVHVFHNPKTGEITEHHVPDWNARYRFMDAGIKLHGGYPNKQQELPFVLQGAEEGFTIKFPTATDTGGNA